MSGTLTMMRCASCRVRRLWQLRIHGYTVTVCPPCDMRPR